MPARTIPHSMKLDETKLDLKDKGRTRRQRVEKKEGAIIAAARHIFTEKGFFKTTMAQIARKAGVANGTVYIYFENKEALARKVVEDFYARLMQSTQIGSINVRLPAKSWNFSPPIICHVSLTSGKFWN